MLRETGLESGRRRGGGLGQRASDRHGERTNALGLHWLAREPESLSLLCRTATTAATAAPRRACLSACVPVSLGACVPVRLITPVLPAQPQARIDETSFRRLCSSRSSCARPACTTAHDLDQHANSPQSHSSPTHAASSCPRYTTIQHTTLPASPPETLQQPPRAGLKMSAAGLPAPVPTSKALQTHARVAVAQSAWLSRPISASLPHTTDFRACTARLENPL